MISARPRIRRDEPGAAAPRLRGVQPSRLGPNPGHIAPRYGRAGFERCRFDGMHSEWPRAHGAGADHYRRHHSSFMILMSRAFRCPRLRARHHPPLDRPALVRVRRRQPDRAERRRDRHVPRRERNLSRPSDDRRADPRRRTRAGQRAREDSERPHRGRRGREQGYSWHLVDVTFAEATIELCDGIPSDVERAGVNFGGGRFCPWSAQVLSIDYAK